MNIEYIPDDTKFGWYSEDNGQVVTTGTVCTNWECWQWRGDVKMSPKLVVNASGFRVCPNCNRGM